MSRNRFRYLAAIGLLLLVGFLVRATSLDAQSLWRDEVDALRFATAPWTEMLNNFMRPGWNGPLYYLLLRGWIALTGTTEYSMRFFSLFFGVLCAPLVYVLGRRLFKSSVGVTSMLLILSSPYVVWYSQEVKMYTLVLALALLAIYSLRRALEGGSWLWWATQIAATSLAFYSHVLAALLVLVQGLLCLAWWPQTQKRWRGALVSLACLTLPYLPLAVWQAPLALQSRDTGFYPYSLGQMVTILLNGWATGVSGWGSPWGTALLSVLAGVALLNGLSGLIRSMGRGTLATLARLPLPPIGISQAMGDLASERGEGSGEQPGWPTGDQTPLILLIWLLVPLLCVWLISLRQPLFTDRYLIWSAPAFYLLVALSLISFATIRQEMRWIVVPLLGAILVVNGVNLRQQAIKPIKSNFRAAAAYVADHQAPSKSPPAAPSEGESLYTVHLPITAAGSQDFDDLIIFQIPYGRYTFDYYFPIEEYPRGEGLYTNHRTPSGEYLLSEEQAGRQMRKLTRGHETVWLVATEVPMWDERNLVQRWLDRHALQTAKAHFHRVDVYRYEFPDR